MPSGFGRLSDHWLSASAVARAAHVHMDQVQTMAEHARIRVLRRPGMPLKYHREDVARLLDSLVTVGPVPATKGELASV